VRIGIDNISPGLSTSRSAVGGMRHFMETVVTGLPKAGREHEFELFMPAWADPFDAPNARNFVVVPDLRAPRNRIARVAYEQLRLPGRIAQRALSVWLGTCNTLPLRAACRQVLIVQSLQFLSHSESYERVRRRYQALLLRLSLRRADAIVTFSQASKDRIVEIFATDPRRIHVTHHGLRFSNATRVGDRDERQRVLGLTDGEYVLSVSAFYPYKNLPRLIEAFARLKPAIKHRLVLIGAPTRFLTVEKIMAIARACGVEKDVLCLGLVPGEELPKFYRNAAVLVMPSLEETFGHPVLEAMAFACPVVTSNRSSMAEIVGEAGILVNPYSVESIADGLDRVLSDTARQQQMAEAGMARARRFTREAFLGRLLRVLVGHD